MGNRDTHDREAVENQRFESSDNIPLQILRQIIKVVDRQGMFTSLSPARTATLDETVREPFSLFPDHCPSVPLSRSTTFATRRLASALPEAPSSAEREADAPPQRFEQPQALQGWLPRTPPLRTLSRHRSRSLPPRAAPSSERCLPDFVWPVTVTELAKVVLDFREALFQPEVNARLVGVPRKAARDKDILVTRDDRSITWRRTICGSAASASESAAAAGSARRWS